MTHALEKQRTNIGIPARADALAAYLSEIDRYSLLSPIEERALAVRYYEHKDIEAAHTLVTSNLRFVVKIAMEYRHYRARLIDLIQEGNIGLMIAVKKFNPYKGYRLISYAVWWIRAYIQAFIVKSWSLVKIGTTQAQRKLFFAFSRIKSSFESETPAKIAEKLNIGEKEIIETEMRMSHPDFSLDSQVADNTYTTHLDLLPGKEASQEEVLTEKEEHSLVRKNLETALQELSPREAYILQNRIMADEPLSLQEIGDKFNITRERARQIETSAIAKVREHLQLPR